MHLLFAIFKECGNFANCAPLSCECVLPSCAFLIPWYNQIDAAKSRKYISLEEVMHKRNRIMSLVLSLALAFALCLGLAGCGACQQDDSPIGGGSENEFVFTGTGTATNGRTLSFVITGDPDGSLEVTVEEIPVLHLPGHWTFVENKGYKIYFDDGTGTFEYTRYDTETGEFYFTTTVSTGSYGTPEVTFTYQDESFAETYDGIGLGRRPPVFNLYGWYGGRLGWDGIIRCAEDGTFIATARPERSETRTGTWTYDEETDTYSLLCDTAVLWANGHEMTEDEWKVAPTGRPDAPIEEWSDRQYELGRGDLTTLSWDEYVARNYCKGPFNTTATYEGDTVTYSISFDFDYIMTYITVFTGTCVYDE